MKVDDFAYQVSVRTMELLHELHHYTITEDLKKQVTTRIQSEINEIIQRSK